MVCNELFFTIKIIWFFFAVYSVECEKDTYGDKAGYKNKCKDCPPNSGTIVNTIALARSDCKCKAGFQMDHSTRNCQRKLITYNIINKKLIFEK